MTTKELIEELKKADPDGTTDVVIGNAPILAAYRSEAYWDGRMQQLVFQDGSGNLTKLKGVRFRTTGWKVSLKTYDFEDALTDFPDINIDVSELSKEEGEYYLREAAKFREEVIRIRSQIEKEKKNK